MLDLAYLVPVFVSVFIVLDPFANAPVFLAFLEKYSEKERAKIIRKSHLIAIVVFLLFSLFGLWIFKYLGIEISSFKVAGGILLFIISIEMLFGFKTQTELSRSEHPLEKKEIEQEKKEEEENLTVTPLAIPLIAGPGAITTGIVLFAGASTFSAMSSFLVASLAAFFVAYLILSRADWFSKAMGSIGMKAVTLIMGLLLMSLAVQYIIAGITESGLLAAV